MNDLRFPRTLREAFGHHTGYNFDEEPPRTSMLMVAASALAFLLVVLLVLTR